MNDSILLKRYFEKGSDDAFSQLVELHWQHVYRACQRRCTQAADADEACQAVFIALAQKPKRCPPQAILPWLLRVAKYVCIDMTRTRQRRHKHEHDAAAEQRNSQRNQNNESEWSHLKPLLDDGIDVLPSKQREAIIAHYFEGKTYKEIATQLDSKPSTIQMRIKSGLHALKNQFAKRGVAVTLLSITGFLQNQVHAAVATSGVSASSISASSLAAVGSGTGGVAIGAAQHALDALLWIKIKVIGVALAAITASASLGAVALNTLTTESQDIPQPKLLQEPVLTLDIPKVIRFGDTIIAEVYCEGFNPKHLLRCDVHWFDKNGKRREKYLHSPVEQKVRSDGRRQFSFTIDKHENEIDILFVVAYVCESDWDDLVKRVTSHEVRIQSRK